MTAMAEQTFKARVIRAFLLARDGHLRRPVHLLDLDHPGHPAAGALRLRSDGHGGKRHRADHHGERARGRILDRSRPTADHGRDLEHIFGFVLLSSLAGAAALLRRRSPRCRLLPGAAGGPPGPGAVRQLPGRCRSTSCRRPCSSARWTSGARRPWTCPARSCRRSSTLVLAWKGAGVWSLVLGQIVLHAVKAR